MAEYQPVDAADRERFRAIHRHAFEPERGPLQAASAGATGEDDEESEDEWPPALGEPRGVFEGDELASVCVRYTFEATVRGEWTEIGGLGGVATPPEHRHEGHAGFLLERTLREYREEDVAYVTLWPASVPFYRHAGWATANRYAECHVAPSALSVVRPDAPGRIRQYSVDDWERLRTVEEHRAERVGLSLRRSERWWRDRTLGVSADDPTPYVYGYERDGDLRGYVVYAFQADGDGRSRQGTNDGRRLAVQDLAAVDLEAERALLGFLADHDSQATTVRLRGRAAEDCFDLGVDPDAMDCSIEAGPMVRLTDVALGLERHDWMASVDATLELDVSDPLLPANDGRFRVIVADGDASVVAVDSDGQGGTPEDADRTVDATVDVGTLSQLCVGSVNVERAERFGGLAVRSDDAREVLEASFDAVPVCLREFF